MNAEIVALRVKLYNVERDLEDSEADNKRLREFIEGLPDGDEIVRLRGLLTRIHGIAAEPRPVNMAVRLENIACIASGERDATYAQLAEAQRFPHGAAAVTGCDMKINDEGRSNAAHWYERAMKAEARLAEAERRNEWMLHNGGLWCDEWPKEWIPKLHGPLIPWLSKRIDAAMGEKP